MPQHCKVRVTGITPMQTRAAHAFRNSGSDKRSGERRMHLADLNSSPSSLYSYHPEHEEARTLYAPCPGAGAPYAGAAA